MKIQNSKFKMQSRSLKFKIFSLFLNFVLCTVILQLTLLNFNLSQATAANPNPAAQILSVSPIIINVPLSPGKTFTKEITVQNMTDNALPLRAALNDFQTTGEEGGYIFEDSKTNPLLSWIKLSDSDLLLNPKESKRIMITITTPKNIPLGGYYGMLFFESVPQNTVTEVTHVLPKVGVLLLANIGVPDPKAQKAEIPTFSLNFLHDDNHIPLLLRVKNISLHYFTAKPILTISPLLPFSQATQPQYLGEKIVFQGKIRRWEQEITLKDATPNIYKAHLMLSTGNGEYITTERYFIVFPFMKVFLGVLLLITLLFILKKRKRIVKALQVLFK